MTPVRAKAAWPRSAVCGGILVGAGLMAVAGAVDAGDPSAIEPAAGASAAEGNAILWLRRIRQSACRGAFAGTFVVSSGGAMSSSRIVHYCDGRSQIERVDALDGHVRRVFRHDGLVHTLWPGSHLALVERRDMVGTPESGGADSADVVNTEVYQALLEGMQRVAGHQAQVLLLKSRDNLRFSQRLWAERTTGLLVRADMIGPRGDVLESSAFSELSLDPQVQPDVLLREMNQLQGYRVTHAVAVGANLADEGWTYRDAVPGFVSTGCIKRPLGGAGGADLTAEASTLQAVFSDGLTHVSVFIEPYRTSMPRPEGLSMLGATGSLTLRRGPWWITVVGDVPPSTLRRFAASIQRRQQ